jgi:NAD-dependent SIR2 family protein deacetylase
MHHRSVENLRLPAGPTVATSRATPPEQAADSLARFLAGHRRVAVLTGAGVSTPSGIPGYRDADGQWMRSPPMTHQAFVGSEAARRRYWARSMIGWPLLRDALPNAAHAALARLEDAGVVNAILTQNVDGLHQRAGSRAVADLHGRIDAVVCLACELRVSRESVQQWLAAANAAWPSTAAQAKRLPLAPPANAARRAPTGNGVCAAACASPPPAGFTPAQRAAPDGDADVDTASDDFCVPACPSCGGMLKPDVVFFGANVPAARVAQAMAALDACDALLVVGSSLAAWSGYRFCLRAREVGKPIVAVNAGVTRADPLLAHKVTADCAQVLPSIAALLA